MTKDEIRIQDNRSKLRTLSIEELLKLQDIELEAIARFNGLADELESALGFLKLGIQLGWKPLALIHSKKTFKKYEEILGIDARTFFPEDTPAASRNTGYKIAKTLTNFWKAVSGDIKIENRRDLT
ncbi:hypothetical protein [Methylotenera sp.]|uniref:hypothetical protein n=1 Tax=Methylotenera sp. TaxID=2051956 RepID=UPI002ED7942E